MRRFLSILILAGIIGAFPINLWAQANLPNNPNAGTMQGPNSTGQLGYPMATVPATGALPWPVTSAGGDGFESTVNSLYMDTPGLAANATFTGVYEDVSEYASVEVFVVVDPTNAYSAFQGCILDWRFDNNGTGPHFSDVVSVSAVNQGTKRSFKFPIRAKWLRFRYINGSVNNNFTKIGLIYHRQSTKASFQYLFIPDFTSTSNIFAGHWEPTLANSPINLLPLAARTTSQTVVAQTNTSYRGGTFTLNITAVPAVPGAGGLDLQIQSEDATGQLTTLNLPLSSRITATGHYVWVMYPGAASTGASMNVKQVLSLPLPPLWAYTVNVGDSQSYTYSLNVNLSQ